MTDYVSYDTHKDIVDYIKDKMEKFVKEGFIKYVEYGEKTGREDYPLAFIIPRRVMLVDITVGDIEWQFTYDVVFVTKDPDLLAGQEFVYKMGWYAYDKFMEDRQMEDTSGNSLGELHPRQIEPDYQRTDDNITHWCLFRFEVHRVRAG